MEELVEVLNNMRAAGIIVNYALFGATAQMRYTEAVATLDADVRVYRRRILATDYTVRQSRNQK